jgi:ubiquinone/menaquinone biosynthesis C-methylase UbiE
MSHTVSQAPQTEGLVIHWAARYDLLVQVLTLGRARRFRERLADLLPVRPGDAVLDVGCGTGDLAQVLAQRVGSGGTVAGIDVSPEMIARARQKARRRGLTIDFRLEPVQALPFADQSFDGVISSLAFHHFPAELRGEALANMARVLKPGGQVCIIDMMPSVGHARWHSATLTGMGDLAEMLRAAGFTEIASGRLKSSSLSLLGVLGMPALGYVSARKPGE